MITLGGAMLALSKIYEVMLVGRLVSGIGAVLLNVLVTKMVTDWFAGRRIVLAMGLLTVLSSLLYWFYSSSLATRQQGGRESQNLRLSRIVLDRIVGEIEFAFAVVVIFFRSTRLKEHVQRQQEHAFQSRFFRRKAPGEVGITRAELDLGLVELDSFDETHRS